MEGGGDLDLSESKDRGDGDRADFLDGDVDTEDKGGCVTGAKVIDFGFTFGDDAVLAAIILCEVAGVAGFTLCEVAVEAGLT